MHGEIKSASLLIRTHATKPAFFIAFPGSLLNISVVPASANYGDPTFFKRRCFGARARTPNQCNRLSSEIKKLLVTASDPMCCHERRRTRNANSRDGGGVRGGGGLDTY